jgi:serine/threonine-protein kinase
MDACNAYLKGEFYRKKLTQNDLETAMKFYQIALEKDPKYALAYCGIAWVWWGFSGMGYLSPSEGQPKEYAALLAALKLDSTLAQVHFGLAIYKTYTQLDWKSGESEFQAAIRINPNHAEARAFYSHLLNALGRPKEAMEQIELALKLDPYDPQIKSLYGGDLLYVHRYNDAIAACREALKIDSTLSPGLCALSFAIHLTGRYTEALESWKSNYYINYSNLVHAFDHGYAKAGYIGALKLEADTLVAQSKTAYINPMDIAFLYVCSDNKKQALDCLENAFEVHDKSLIYLSLPIFDSLHNEPRFQALCRKMNLPIR